MPAGRDRLCSGGSGDLEQVAPVSARQSRLHERVLAAERCALDDLPALCRALLASSGLRGEVPERGPVLDRLQGYAWPGNVRELRSVVERALVLDPARGLEGPGMLPAASEPVARTTEGQEDLNLRDAVNRLERDLLLEAQRRSGGVRKEAARLLGIDPRNLAYYLRKHGFADSGETGGPGPASQ